MNNPNNIGIFLIKKIIRLATLLIAVCIVSFILMEKSPIDPIKAYVGADLSVTQEQREEIANHWGLNKPPVERFISWFSSILKGDFGT
ncbi:ABC transporter permease, partial [Casaltella massiliensis]|nr:ABC transporter permease [Casaltella massiliensis]